jgi:hypothetical protein
MTSSFGKRKYAGPRPQELRQIDQDPMRLPPHKKPKVWTLTVEWEETTAWTRTREFTSRAARDEAKSRIQRAFAEREKREATKTARPYRYWDKRAVFAEFDDLERGRFKTRPVFTEGYEGG